MLFLILALRWQTQWSPSGPFYLLRLPLLHFVRSADTSFARSCFNNKISVGMDLRCRQLSGCLNLTLFLFHQIGLQRQEIWAKCLILASILFDEYNYNFFQLDTKYEFSYQDMIRDSHVPKLTQSRTLLETVPMPLPYQYFEFIFQGFFVGRQLGKSQWVLGVLGHGSEM